MGFLKKIRKNILNQDNSFHIGFGNRSPFSYTNQYGGDWTPEVPAIETPETDLGEMDLLKAQIGLAGDIRDAGIDIAQAYKKHEDELAGPRLAKRVTRREKRLGKRTEDNEPGYAVDIKTIPGGGLIPNIQIEYQPGEAGEKGRKMQEKTEEIKQRITQTGKTTNKQKALIMKEMQCALAGKVWDSTTNTCT